MSTGKRFLLRVLPATGVKLIHVLRHPEMYRFVNDLTYDQDGLATQHNCDFMEDERFVRAYQQGESTGSWSDAKVHWRAHVACWAADRAKELAGDFVECGVNKGGLALTVAHYVQFQTLNKTFYLLDTFRGLTEKYLSEEEKRLRGGESGYEECYAEVKETFRPFTNVVIVRGAVPETLDQVKSEMISYLSIDMNCVEPEIEAAEFFWKKLVSGAVLLLDDYGWAGHIAQKRAFDQFAAEKGVPILSLPTGQGLIIKP
jgi:O-methyltransferase